MKFLSILLLATAAFKRSNSKSVSSNFNYEFNCNDRNNVCVAVRKELASAVSSLSSILDISPVQFDVIFDDISKFRNSTESDTFGAAVSNSFELLYSKKGTITSPYPNAQTLINTYNSGNKFAQDDFILLLNSFNSNPDYKEAYSSDYKNNAIKEIFKGLLNLDKLPEPYKSSSNGSAPKPPSGGSSGYPPPPSGGSPPPGGFPGGNPPPLPSSNICETIKSNRNTTAFLESTKKQDETCQNARLNKLSSILNWKNRLITKDSSGKQSYKRLISIGDIHGDYDKLVSVLQHAKLINKNKKWIASNTVVVQTGDLIDRGDDIKKILDLLIDLIEQAKKKKSEIHLLLGNHEIINLQASYGFVSTGDVNSFGSLEGREQAFSPNGKYGKLVRSLDVAFIINDTLFAHAG